MSTLHHMDMALIDLRNRFSNELQFGTDGKRAILLTLDSARQAVKVLSDCLDDVEAAVVNTLDERQRALAAALGNPGAVADGLDLPVAVQNNPVNMDVSLSNASLLRLRDEHPNITMLKGEGRAVGVAELVKAAAAGGEG